MVDSDPLETEQNVKALRRHAIMLLTRREQSAKELLQKLVTKGYAADLIRNLLHDLSKEGLQSDARFAESYVRFRREKGFGPIHILQELQQRGVAKDIIASVLDMQDPRWLEYLQKVRIKRFGEEFPQSLKEHAKQCRFLAYRGFSQDQIAGVLSDEEVY